MSMVSSDHVYWQEMELTKGSNLETKTKVLISINISYTTTRIFEDWTGKITRQNISVLINSYLSYGSQKDSSLKILGYNQLSDWSHKFLTGIFEDFNFSHSASSKQQAWPILCGKKSSIECISVGLGTYKRLKK